MPRPAQIDRTAVLRVSLAIADERGLGGVTMQAVAERLGVTPMALYRHVRNKSDLLDGLVECLLEGVIAPDDNLPWDEQLAGIGRALRETARRHPAVFPLLLQLPASTPQAMRSRGVLHTCLRQAGVAPEHVARVERIVGTLALGFAASEVSGRFRGHDRETLDEDYRALQTFILAGLEPFRARDRFD
jgi:AcrR family transcriptional regulator